jgi:YegS/Rv2252/BmrU family lipid kinase
VRRTCLIVNPRSAGGATARRMAEIGAAADRQLASWDLRRTEGPEHATELCREALEQGFDAVVAVGGDGTANEVVNGFFDEGEPLDVTTDFAVVPAGTGCDLIKTLRMPRSLDESFAMVEAGEGRPMDVFRVRYIDHEGTPSVRMGLNVSGIGMAGDVVARANRSSKRFGGRVTFLGATLATLRHAKPAMLWLRWTDAEGEDQEWRGMHLNTFLANGEYAGGGMWLGKGAEVDDGLFECTLIPDLPLLDLARGLPHLYTGETARMPGVLRFRASRVEFRVEGEQQILFDVDGEQPGRLDASWEMLPRSMRVIRARREKEA